MLLNHTAECKLNSILDIINQAINDNAISDLEFRLIIDEITKYNELKKNIQSKAVVNNDNSISEEQKNLDHRAGKKRFYKSIEMTFATLSNTFKCSITIVRDDNDMSVDIPEGQANVRTHLHRSKCSNIIV